MAPSADHLNMIQAVIARLAQNSFVVKGWSVTIAAALLGLSAADNDRSFAWVAVGVVSVFALLDAWYLGHERQYRQLYNAKAEPDAVADWSMNAGKPGPGGVLSALMSWSVVLPHGAALVASLGVAILG